MEIDLRDFEHRLGQPIPSVYAEFVRNTKPIVLSERGFDPKTLCVLNLELRSSDRVGWTTDRFFLSGDGCGNYFFVQAEQCANQVFLWAHDPPGIENPRIDLSHFLQTAAQECRILETVHDGYLSIARTNPVGESILDPISLDEWISAIANCDGIRHVGYRDRKNPFTGLIERFEELGESVADFHGESRRFRLTCGRIVSEYSPMMLPIAKTLSRLLNANLYT